MVHIASRSRYATTSLVYELHHIARSVLYQIGEEHRIAGYDQEASTSHESSIRPLLSSTAVCMQPIRGRGRGKRRVDHRGRGQDGEGGRGTPEPTLPTSIPPIFTPHPRFLYPHTLTHHLPYPHTLTHHLPYPHTLTHHLPFPHTLTLHIPYPQTLTHIYHIRCRQSQSQHP